MIGKTISHYKILEKLGEGGMGVVYKAEDTKLERFVALKFLPAHVSDEAAQRFINEAHAAAALNHPHICTIHGIDEHNGRSFIAMEFIEGHSLKDRMQKGPLAISDFLSITIQIAEGLREAHEKGIVHRDIKPGNIMLTPRGQAKILDFGLARLGARAKITKADKTVGTVTYMSPEQAMGIEVDRRSDIWSLGVMFYEILTGRLPFQADYDQAIVYAILNLDPEPISSFRQGVPLELEQLIYKALAKNREDRFEDVEDMLSNLQAIEGQLASASDTGRTQSKKSTSSIAVLPFANLSADPEQEYFCDGLAEEIINALGRLENLRVVARTSAFSFKGKAIDIREIGSKLNVATLLEGSVRKAGNRLRISVQLINVADGYHLWSEKYDREMEDIFAIQDEISLAIVDNLKLKVLRDERAKLVKRQTENPDAHNLYLMGRYFWNKRTKADIRRSVDHFQKAVEIDPTYALAYSGMAEAYVTMGIYGCLPFEEISTKAKAAVATALKLDSTLSQAHASLAMIKIWIDWDCAGAEREFRLALNLNPADAEAHHQYGHLLAQLGRFEEAVAEMKYALELEPLSLNINACLGQVLFLARRYDGSIEQLQKTIEMNPGYYDGHGWLAMAYLLKGYYQKAIAKFKEASAFGEIKARMTACLGYTHAVTGEENMARDILARMKDESGGKEIEPYLIATVYAGLGDVDRTIEYLTKAYEARSHRLFTMLKVCPLLDVVRSDPRYKDLLQKLGLE